MSGGKDRSKTRSNKTQGWEEAGAEFYQESYPADLEGVMQRDPAAIATLLPSKQTRNATTRRGRAHTNQQDTKSTRNKGQQTSTRRRRNSSVRRGSQYQNEVQVSMLPDLSENLTDEERIWEEIHEIKSMPISMAEKKQMKAQLQNATKLRLQGFDQIKWQRRKVWQQLESKWKEYLTKLELWHTSLKTIEGNFGTGVVAYFVFLRWLMFLNFIIFLLIFSFIVLPQITLFDNELITSESIDNLNDNDDGGGSGFCDINSTSIKCCSELYFINETNEMTSSSSSSFSLLDIIQGTGNMERTIIFYGMYSNKIYGYDVPIIEGKSTQSPAAPSTISTTIASFNNINNNNNNNNINNNIPDGQRQSIPIESEIKKHLYYNLPLAYISVSAVYFLLSLAAIIKSAARGFKDRLVEGEGQFYQYCNLIFGGWDFCIHNEKSAIIKHKALYNELSGLLQAKRMEIDRQNRSSDVICKLYAIRAIINLLIIIILAASAFLIYTLIEISTTNLRALRDNTNNNNNNGMETKLFNLSSPINYTQLNTNGYYHTSPSMLTRDAYYYRQQQRQSPLSLDDQWINLFFEFLPYIAIVGLNLIVPIGFNYLVQFEKYLPVFVIKITLVRTVLLRLASLCVLLTRIYLDVSTIENNSSDNNNNNNNDTMVVVDDGMTRIAPFTNTINDNENITDFMMMAGNNKDLAIIKMSVEMKCLNGANHLCWETFVGQQFYKLLITDFFIHFAVTFLINFPRSIIAKYTKNNWMRFLCEQEFELPKHVLDIVYSQTLCWLGSFYAPFLTAIAVVLNFFMFYIKRFQCLVNSRPSAILYRASRSNSLFMFTLLFAFFLSFCSIVFAVAELRPSRACGPYRGLPSVWMSAVTTFTTFPDELKGIFFFIGTAGFAIPVLIILILFLYYYYAVSAANKHMVDVLKNQLILEGHDKQFLLNRLSSFLKQQQEYQKKMRQVELRQQRDRERDRQQQQQTPGGSSLNIGPGNANIPNVNSNNMDSQ